MQLGTRVLAVPPTQILAILHLGQGSGGTGSSAISSQGPDSFRPQRGSAKQELSECIPRVSQSKVGITKRRPGQLRVHMGQMAALLMTVLPMRDPKLCSHPLYPRGHTALLLLPLPAAGGLVQAEWKQEGQGFPALLGVVCKWGPCVGSSCCLF